LHHQANREDEIVTDTIQQAWQTPHRRYNPLRGSWVLVSPQRTQRPWQGEVTKRPTEEALHYDPACYLCPGNTRAGGHKNPKYTGVFAFDNDYAALMPHSPDVPASETSPLLVADNESGRCRVLCFHPDHSLTIARMKVDDIARVVKAWTEETRTLSAMPEISYVQIFENRGAMMGASNPHPHCQIWATEHVPDEPLKELSWQKIYQTANNSCLLCDYLKIEIERAQRIVVENDSFVAVVPFWAVWPFETLLLSRRHFGSFEDFSMAERRALADLMKRLTTHYDNLFEVSFPYTMGFHQSPADGEPHPEWHFHAHYYPPLLRSAEIRKFMVGFEMLGMPQRDITPEIAAQRLRDTPEKHYAE
jgi:UDPglucose--hexose-1-phosphate uridylyltransferase